MCCSFWMPVASIQLLSLAPCCHLLETLWVPDARNGCGFWWALEVSKASVTAGHRGGCAVCFEPVVDPVQILWLQCWNWLCSPVGCSFCIGIFTVWLMQSWGVLPKPSSSLNTQPERPSSLKTDFILASMKRMGIALKLPTTLHDWDHLQYYQRYGSAIRFMQNTFVEEISFRKAGQKPTLEQWIQVLGSSACLKKEQAVFKQKWLSSISQDRASAVLSKGPSLLLAVRRGSGRHWYHLPSTGLPCPTTACTCPALPSPRKLTIRAILGTVWERIVKFGQIIVEENTHSSEKAKY